MTKGKKSESINFEVMEELRKISNDAFNRGEFLSSSLIIFQMIEALLRIQIGWCSRNNNVDEEAIKKASETEQSFSRLVLYFDLVNPKNAISDKLSKYGRDRNKIVHELFYFKSFESLKEKLRDFCKDGLNLLPILLDLPKSKKN